MAHLAKTAAAHVAEAGNDRLRLVAVASTDVPEPGIPVGKAARRVAPADHSPTVPGDDMDGPADLAEEDAARTTGEVGRLDAVVTVSPVAFPSPTSVPVDAARGRPLVPANAAILPAATAAAVRTPVRPTAVVAVVTVLGLPHVVVGLLHIVRGPVLPAGPYPVERRRDSETSRTPQRVFWRRGGQRYCPSAPAKHALTRNVCGG